MPNITEIRCKQALHKVNKEGLPQEWDLNLYRGCQHGCVYCFAIYSHDYLNPDGNYYEDIYVKVNIVEQLEKQLRSPNWQKETIAIAGVTDCYQPIEAKYKLMPEILKLMIKYKNPVAISTKSNLILRDYDLIDELSRITDVSITASIVCMDNDVRRKIEPVGRNAKQKFNMLKEFSKTNATTGMLQMPIIPYITDSRDNIEDLYAHAKDAEVNFIVPGMLYLRGKTRGVFFDFIKREFPDLFIPLTKLYQKGGRTGYRKSLYRMINELQRKYGLSSYYSKKPTPKVDEITEIKKVAEGFQQLSLFEMNEPQTYQSSSIPNRDQLVAKPSQKTPKVVAESDLASFVEIEMGSTKPASTPTSISLPPDRPIDTITCEKRALFYSMRQIARDAASYTDHSKVFYEQALFMKNFEDEYTESAPFSSYFPYYQRMGYEQLRTYFTWRTKVRNGTITTTSTSYAFLYIYELLNQIGVENPEDGLEKLLTFWQSFRTLDGVLDQYVLQWLKDYHIYYPLPHSFREFVDEHQLMMHYPTVFGYESSKQDSFDLFATISKYDIKKSVFYHDENHEMINDCFYFVLERFREYFRAQKQCFEDLILYPLAKEVTWIPFNRALFYPAMKQSERQVVLTQKEIYNYKGNRWQYKSVMLSDHGRQLVGYIMKEMECSLRRIVKFKYKLTANPNVCDEKTLATFNKMGITLTEFIQTCVQEFYTLFTRKIVSVDTSNLQQIRKDALQTQEKLIVPEEDEPAIRKVEQLVQQPVVAKSSPSDPWNELKAMLTEIELEALRLLLDGESIKAFALESMVMLEVLIDGINDKAMDCIGDTLLELDDTIILYEDYLDDVTKMLEL